MRRRQRVFGVFLAALALSSLPMSHAAPPPLLGDYESARSADDEYTRLSLQANGRATIVAEHNFQIPGDESRRRGRTTRFAKWTRKGSVVTLTYAKVSDRLRFDANTSLAPIGASGAAPALTQINPISKDSRLKGLILWRAPHRYKLPPVPDAADKGGNG